MITMLRTMWKEKKFYKKVLLIAIPIMVQNGVTNFVGMLDNVMIGQTGTDAMTGVSIVNQLIFVFNLMVYGGLSGIGIFTAQFYGKGDIRHVRLTMRLMFYMGLFLLTLGIGTFLLFGTPLISLYIHEDGNADIAATLLFATQYLRIMLLGFLPFTVSYIYSTVLRSSGDTVLPMNASLAAVLINLVGNYLFIYGKFGFPRLGVNGAAIATVISRFAEAAIMITVCLRKPEKYGFIRTVLKSFRVPLYLVRDSLRSALPLLLNESLWALGQAVLMQNYSLRGLSVIAAINITFTLQDVFNVSFISMGNAIAIVIGQILGSGDTENARHHAPRLMLFSLLISLIFAFLLFLASFFFPEVYNTTSEIRRLAGSLIRIVALCVPIYTVANASYFIIRSGGRTLVTFLFDSCFSWLVSIPVCFILIHFTVLPITTVYFSVQMMDILKSGIGIRLVKKGIWVQNLAG